jgi:adenosine deaminase
MNTEAFLREIPKYDIHVHLDGSLRIPTLIELAREYNVELPTYDEVELRQKVFNGGYEHLPDYLEGFKYTVGVMQTARAVERIAYEFAVDNYSEGVRYFEVRFAPQLHASINPDDNFNITEVFQSVDAGLMRATNEFNCRLIEENREHEPKYDYGMIGCAIRGIFPGMSRYYDALFAIHKDTVNGDMVSLASELLVRNIIHCRETYNLKIVAIDIAGAEDGFENKFHRKAYEVAHEYLMNKTVHAGEGFGPESIAQAVKQLHTDRIGHGFHLFNTSLISPDNSCHREEYVKRLVKYVSDRRIAFEVCLTSNLDTMPSLTIDKHAFKDMLACNVSITLNTDNRLMSNTTTVNELKLAVDTFKLTNKQLKEIVICGFKRSFYHGSYAERRAYVRKIMNFYDVIAAKHGVI